MGSSLWLPLEPFVGEFHADDGNLIAGSVEGRPIDLARPGAVEIPAHLFGDTVAVLEDHRAILALDAAVESGLMPVEKHPGIDSVAEAPLENDVGDLDAAGKFA